MSRFISTDTMGLTFLDPPAPKPAPQETEDKAGGKFTVYGNLRADQGAKDRYGDQVLVGAYDTQDEAEAAWKKVHGKPYESGYILTPDGVTIRRALGDYDPRLETNKAKILFELRDRGAESIGEPRDPDKRRAAEELVKDGTLVKDGSRYRLKSHEGEEKAVEAKALSDLESNPQFAGYRTMLLNSIRSQPRSIRDLRKLLSDRQLVDAAVSNLLRTGQVEDVDDSKGGTVYRVKSVQLENEGRMKTTDKAGLPEVGETMTIGGFGTVTVAKVEPWEPNRSKLQVTFTDGRKLVMGGGPGGGKVDGQAIMELLLAGKKSKAIHKRAKGQYVETVDDDNSIWVMTTGDTDRDGETVDPEGIDFSEFDLNPVVIDNHNTEGPVHEVVIGKVVRHWLDTVGDGTQWPQVKGPPRKAQMAEIAWNTATPNGQKAADSARLGMLNGGSISFQPEGTSSKNRSGGNHYARAKLLEFTICPVGSNPSAIRVKSLKTAPAKRWRSVGKAMNRTATMANIGFVMATGRANPETEHALFQLVGSGTDLDAFKRKLRSSSDDVLREALAIINRFQPGSLPAGWETSAKRLVISKASPEQTAADLRRYLGDGAYAYAERMAKEVGGSWKDVLRLLPIKSKRWISKATARTLENWERFHEWVKQQPDGKTGDALVLAMRWAREVGLSSKERQDLGNYINHKSLEKGPNTTLVDDPARGHVSSDRFFRPGDQVVARKWLGFMPPGTYKTTVFAKSGDVLTLTSVQFPDQPVPGTMKARNAEGLEMTVDYNDVRRQSSRRSWRAKVAAR